MSAHRTASSPVRSDDADGMRRSQMLDAIVTAQTQIARQQEQIRSISEENEQLKKEIVHVSGTQYDYVKADKLATLQGDVDALERRYQFEKMRKNDLTKRYQLARIDLLQSRRMKGGVNVEKEQAEAVQRQVDILENRLDQALGKFNDALSFNKELRERIDIIREERRVFQRVHKRMEDDLRTKKLQMAERIEQSNKDMDERDGYVRQAEQLQAALAEQQREYTEQLRAMDAAMVDIKTMREEQANMQLELEAREYEFESQLANRNFTATGGAAATATTASGGGTLANTTSTTNSNTGNNSNALASTVAGGGGNNNNNATAASTRLTRTLSRRGDELGGGGAAGGGEFGGGGTYHSMFAYHDDDEGSSATAGAHDGEHESHTITDIVARIRDALHNDDLDALLHEYESLGDGNFSLYKYLNELTVTREGLVDEIRDLQLLLQEEHDSDVRQRRLIKALEEKLARTEGQLGEVRGSAAVYAETLARVMQLTREVYKRIGCTATVHKDADAATAAAEGDVDGGVCNEETLMAYLGAIEQRANHVVCAYLRWQQLHQQQQTTTTTTMTTAQQQQQQRHRGAAYGRGATTTTSSMASTPPPHADDGAGSTSRLLAAGGGGGAVPPPVSVRGGKDDYRAADKRKSKADDREDSRDAADGDDDDDEDKDAGVSGRGGGGGEVDATASQASSARGTLPPQLSAEEMDNDAIPLLPLAPRLVHNAVSAQRLVRFADLPSASLGVAETGSTLLGGGERDDDHIVSHEEIRRQLEARYVASREQQQQQPSSFATAAAAVTAAARRRHNKDVSNGGGSSGNYTHGGAAATGAASSGITTTTVRPRLSATAMPRAR